MDDFVRAIDAVESDQPIPVAQKEKVLAILRWYRDVVPGSQYDPAYRVPESGVVQWQYPKERKEGIGHK